MHGLLARFLAEPLWFQAANGVLLLMLLGALLGIALRRRSQNGRPSFFDGARQPGSELQAGPALLTGHVELAQGEQRVLHLTATQWGREYRVEAVKRSHGVDYHCVWKESDRHMRAAPFYLRLEGGERVRVEPAENVFLLDDLPPTQRPSKSRRIFEAEVNEADVAFVFGDLTRARDPEAAPGGGDYRSASREGWVLRAPRAGSLLVSTEQPGDILRAAVRPTDGGTIAQGLGLVLGGFLGVASVSTGSAVGLALAMVFFAVVHVSVLRPPAPARYEPRRLDHREAGTLSDAEPTFKPS